MFSVPHYGCCVNGMVIVVVCMNVMLAFVLLSLAAWIWQLQYRLARAALVLTRAERSTHRVLYRAPEAIRQGQLGIHDLHRTLQQVETTLTQAQQGMAILGFGLSFWRQRSRRRTGSVTVRR